MPSLSSACFFCVPARFSFCLRLDCVFIIRRFLKLSSEFYDHVADTEMLEAISERNS